MEEVMQTLWQDMRYGARMLFKNSGFALIIIITLALGIGANTAIFSVVDKVMVRMLPVPEPERLVRLVGRGEQGSIFSQPLYANYRDNNDVLTGLAAYCE